MNMIFHNYKLLINYRALTNVVLQKEKNFFPLNITKD